MRQQGLFIYALSTHKKYSLSTLLKVHPASTLIKMTVENKTIN